MELPPVLNELREKRQWVCHKNKVPKNPNTGNNAMADEKSTWSDFDTAIEAMAHWNFDGVGFQFGYFEPYSLRVSGIDLDHVVRPDGTLEPFAQEIVDRMNSYTELSQWASYSLLHENEGYREQGKVVWRLRFGDVYM